MSDVNIQTFSGKVNVTDNFKVGAGHLFVDTQDNKVGLNTATPNSSLHVNGNAYVATDITFGGTLTGDGSGLTNVGSGPWSSGTGNVYLSTTTDKVGIGTSSPDATLHVTGNAYISSELTTNSNISVGYNQAIRSYFGKVAIGHNGYHTANATFAHVNTMGRYDYALKQNGSGRTDINSASGQDILFKNADTEKAKLTSTGNFVVNTDTLFVDATNSRVGVGTPSPGQKLSVYTGSTSTAALSFDRFASGNYRTDIYQNTYGADFRVGYNTYTPESILYLKRFSDGAKEVEINGNVGIGTASPEGALHIAVDSADGNTTDNALIIGGPTDCTGNTNLRIGCHNDYAWLQSHCGEPLNLNPLGNNVGIGTTNPGAKLEVNGSILTSAASSYNAAIQLGSQTSYSDDQLYSLRWGGNSLMGMGLHSSTRGAFGKQGVALHIPNTEEFSVKTNNWTNLLAIDGASSQVRLYGSQSYPNRPMAMVGKNNGRVYINNYVIFNVVGYNDANIYNSGNGRFTAPYAGFYLFTTTLLGGERETNSNTRWFKNGVDTQWGAAHFNMGSGVNMNTTNARNGLSSQMIYYMNSGDYMQLRMVGGSMYGSHQLHTTTLCIFLGSR